MYRKRDCISERPSIETSEPPANGAITNDEPFELIYKDGSTWPDTVTQALLLQKPKEGAVMQQALIGHALDGQYFQTSELILSSYVVAIRALNCIVSIWPAC